MTSAFHRPPFLPPDAQFISRRRVTWRLHPVLTYVLNTLEDTPLGQSFKDRAVEVSTLRIFGDPPDYAAVLTAQRWLLERADGDGLPLTAAGYLKPADVQALAEVLPTMRDWMFSVSREIDVHPVLSFREQLKKIRLLRKYKGTLRLTKTGRDGLADATVLWRSLADALVPEQPEFAADASVVILVHAATTDGELDIDAIANTLSALGWCQDDGSPVDRIHVYDVWNDLWAVIGNVGERSDTDFMDRALSPAARILIHDSLFDETISDPIS